MPWSKTLPSPRHASYTFFFQFFDFVGMFIFCFVMIVLNWQRMGRLRDEQLPLGQVGGLFDSKSRALSPRDIAK
jgi:hypothetical protein